MEMSRKSELDAILAKHAKACVKEFLDHAIFTAAVEAFTDAAESYFQALREDIHDATSQDNGCCTKRQQQHPFSVTR